LKKDYATQAVRRNRPIFFILHLRKQLESFCRIAAFQIGGEHGIAAYSIRATIRAPEEDMLSFEDCAALAIHANQAADDKNIEFE
jgi:hypothetical protein